ncbi:AMP-binding protein [Nonomuraea sp. NPDC005983]|uniref:AMP-binding protein n=1 Tax=Nonomuraea sp. NPDC005983 TaxID=3155595 RepID=UPI0033ACC9B6
MPMVPEAVFAMLACARLGAVHSVVSGGFAAGELAARIDHAKPRVVLSASCGIEPARVVEYKPLLDAALEQAEHRPASCVVLQRERCPATLVEGRNVDWDESVAKAAPAGWSATGSAPSPPSAGRWSSAACPRSARARSSAPPCATSPTGLPTARRPRSRTRRR